MKTSKDRSHDDFDASCCPFDFAVDDAVKPFDTLLSARPTVDSGTTLETQQREPLWRTSSLPDAPTPSPAEVDALSKQLRECDASRGWLFALRAWLEGIRGLVCRHLITTLVVAGLAGAALFIVVGAG